MIRFLKLKVHQIGRKVKASPFLNKYFPRFRDRVYWAGDRLSFARAGFIGAFCMMLPVPFQMLLGSILAYYTRANIPLATALAWITNPLTMGFIWYGGYRFGTWLLDTPPLKNIDPNIEIASQQWFSDIFPHIWQPFFLGNMVLGVIIGTIFYLLIAHFHGIQLLKQLFHKPAKSGQ
ncbi:MULTISPECIES: DUF2062 domain-containing protein [Piscirickettsiaceae]|jgi:uncharacterized protein (DUF2062 family)|uniref:DUF2062 domain-containing protein n=1 Tax=Hydrogenovibrio thermophilus TaxID=265883 RepID=A0A410H1J3_9GAMM|nr:MULTISPECIES: DUF2062 domain-containing protein [Piscirickettsiaceae]AZR82646.1 hypothetical protein AYJ59_10375 [Thiomicrospira sp. S5]QAB14789.1 DUF2062 domain-containing protein [Hydrogenovibrio thermophilus]